MKPKILITNDDGIDSLGLKSLWRALSPFADLTIVAPMYDQSGVGLGITIRTPLQMESVKWDEKTPAWKVNGTPADCVKLGISVVLKEKPDLIVSGINRGSNAGRTVLYSGTIAGTIEGALRHVPGIAFSYELFDNPDFTILEKHIYPIVEHVLQQPLPLGTIFNVNFPRKDVIGVRMARQGRGYQLDDPTKRIHPEGNPYFWLGGKWSHHDEHDESDISLLSQGFATVVPIHIDELTDEQLFEERKHQFNDAMKTT